MPDGTSTKPAPVSLDELIGGKELLKLVVQRLSSQLLLFSVAVIVFVLAAFFLFEEQGLQVTLAIIFVFVVGAVGYLFAEEKKKLKAEEPEAVSRALEAQLASIVQRETAPSGGRSFQIDLRVERLPAAGSRDIAVIASNSDSKPPAFHIGDRVNIVFEASRDCYLTLLNVGTSGKLTILFPNAMQPDNRIAAGQSHAIPGTSYGFEYVLQGPPGREMLKAVATLEPVALIESSFAPDGSLFREERATAAARDIAVVKTKTQEMAPDAWAEAHLEFDVLS